MLSNRLILAALAGTCVVAAGAGGYLATRHNVANVAAPAAAAATQSTLPVEQPVQETEAVVTAPPKVESLAPAAVPTTPPAAPRIARTGPTGGAPVARPRTPQPQTQRTPEPPALERSWPTSSAQTSQAAPTPSAESQDPAARIEERQEPVRAPEPPAKTFDELIVAADSVIGLQTESALSSELSRVEDRVEAKVVRDVRVGGEVAIPAGTRAIGSVVSVERGGKFRERARLGIRFESLMLADGTRLPITTETIYRYGNAPANQTAAKVGGGAVVGAIIGGIIGGGKGAAIGATTGAGAGTASVMAGDRSVATFPAGTEVTARILSPVTVTVEK